MSCTLRQNGLRNLEARIKSLPDQERLKRLRDIFRNTQAVAIERRDDLQSALARVKALRTIQGDSHVLEADVSACLLTTKGKAGELDELIAATSPESNKIGARLDAIKRAITSTNGAIATTWSGICRQYDDRVQALRPLAEKLNPQLIGPIDTLVHLLRSHGGSPPTSATALQALLDAIAAFDAAIRSMKIDGPVGKFLRDASTGGADPRSLFEPEIKKYIDDNPALWTALRVALK